jgi:hypothetical protein
MGKPFLRKAALVAQAAKIHRESLSQVHPAQDNALTIRTLRAKTSYMMV